MSAALLPPEVIEHLNDLFTRFHIGAATYVFEADPFTVPEDEPILDHIRAVRDEDHAHARLIAQLILSHDLVPEAGVFPYWHRDLNYLTVPYMAGFVVGSLEEDLRRIDRAAAETPDDIRIVHTTLRAIREERAARLEILRPVAREAKAREAAAYQAAIDEIRETREARLAKEKAAAAAARKAAQEARKKAAAEKKAERKVGGDPTAGLPDPDEPGISSKEKAKRTMLIKRAQKKAAAEKSAAGDPLASMPDPDEPGISPKEKAKRTMMIKRAQKKAAAEDAEKAETAEKKAEGDPLASMPDPDEPGISPKERARRTMMIKRAQKKAATEDAEKSGGAGGAA